MVVPRVCPGGDQLVVSGTGYGYQCVAPPLPCVGGGGGGEWEFVGGHLLAVTVSAVFSAAVLIGVMHISKAAVFGLVPMELCTGASLRTPLLKWPFFYYNL